MIDSMKVNKISLGSRKGKKNQSVVPDFNNFEFLNCFKQKGKISYYASYI